MHVYEINPRKRDAYIRSKGGWDGCVLAAKAYLEEHAEEVEVGCYHTYPSPGPVRRYMGCVYRQADGKLGFREGV